VIWGSTANISSLSRETSCRDRLAGFRWLDESSGVLYDFLSERGAIATTYIVMSTDHGSAKKTLFETGTRVPLYAVGPSIHAGTVVDEIVSHIDMSPTFLEWATGGAWIAVDGDGQSWASLASGTVRSLDRDGVYTEFDFDRAFVASNGMKYYNCSTSKMLESMGVDKTLAENMAHSVGAAYPHMYDEIQVYNLSADPTEQVNLWNLKGELPP
jgi:arylsulfatase A-like enzyme